MLGVRLSEAFIRGLEFIKHGYPFIIFTVLNIKHSNDMCTRRQTPKRTAKRDDMPKNGEQGERTSWIQVMKLLKGDGLRALFSTRREKDTIMVPNESKSYIKE